MYGFNRLKIALQALATNRVRTAMIMLTFSLGAILLVLTISLRAGVEDQVTALMDIFAQPNAGEIFYPDIGGVGDRRSFPFSGRLKDLQLLKSRLGHEAVFAGFLPREAAVSHADRRLSLLITAVGPSYMEIKGWTIERGETLDQEDEKTIKRVCILTTDVAAILFGTQPSIGGEVKIAGVPFRVKGVRPVNQFVARVSRGSARLVLVPLSTGMKRLWNFEGPEAIHFKARKHFPVEKVQKDITALLRKEHHIAPGHPNDFKFLIGARLAQGYRRNKRPLILAGFALSLLALLLAAGVAAITMVTAMAHRKGEFALKRAIGARQKDLWIEVMVESVLVSIGGLIIGAVVSCGVLVLWHYSPEAFKKIPLNFDVSSFIIAACLEVLIGIACGALVARRLKSLSP